MCRWRICFERFRTCVVVKSQLLFNKMSVNKYMHPRNIYKKPPNFKQLAIDYPEFRKYIKQDITGKIRIDFKDNESLRCLTQTLLKKDFDLDVHIPLNRLIPTVPLRLNYILWLEDLLSISTDKPSENIHGIDIGTGASCIYPLLAAKKNRWRMTATEIDPESTKIAQENVTKNNLQHLITIKHNTNETLLKNLIDSNITYDFCMCNPPFFASASELNPEFKARTASRPLPRNALSGTSSEVVAQGGEVEFISKLIQESLEFKHQVRVFTTMVGHKSSIAPLKMLLRAVEVVSFKQTEFHQGHTTRWGLSWTFLNLDLRKLPEATVPSSKKKAKPPQKFVLPKNYENLDEIVQKTRNLLQTLQMTYEQIKQNKFMYAMQVTAQTNTWSNQRRKRRQELKKQNDSTSDTSAVEEMEINTSTDKNTSTESGEKKRPREESEDEEYYDVKKLKIHEDQIYLRFNCIVRKLSDEFHLELCYLEGSANKDSVHQIMQYFKNNFK